MLSRGTYCWVEIQASSHELQLLLCCSTLARAAYVSIPKAKSDANRKQLVRDTIRRVAKFGDVQAVSECKQLFDELRGAGKYHRNGTGINVARVDVQNYSPYRHLSPYRLGA